MLDDVKRFDMQRSPLRQHLLPIAWVLAAATLIPHKNQLKKMDMEGVKPPYLLLCNHNAFLDFSVSSRAIFPHRGNYVVAIDGFLKREWLLRLVGCICKRKFTRDLTLIRQLKRVVDRGDIAVLYPEARYSLCGTTAVLPDSLGKLCKLLKVPVVMLMCHGHHVNSPFWNLHDRGVKPTEAEMTCLFTKDELEKTTVEEVNETIRKAFIYDDFAWQKEKGVRVTYEGRAEGLQKVLYQCPHCGKEFHMDSRDDILFCGECGKKWRMTELGELEALEGETEFSHIPDWYEWERANVRAEVEAGTYDSGPLRVHVDSLPNAKKFIRLGNGTMQHDMTGFHVHGTDVDGDPFEMELPVPSLYSVHIEYEYLGKYGDCVDLNTLQDTWYTYPEPDQKFAVTKMALATEELYYAHRRAIGKPCPPGLA